MNTKRILLASILAITSNLAIAQASTEEARQLDPKVRAKIEAEWRAKAGKDGSISKETFLQSMEGHWHTYEKRHSHLGKVKPEDMPRIMMFLSGQDASPL